MTSQSRSSIGGPPFAACPPRPRFVGWSRGASRRRPSLASGHAAARAGHPERTKARGVTCGNRTVSHPPVPISIVENRKLAPRRWRQILRRHDQLAVAAGAELMDAPVWKATIARPGVDLRLASGLDEKGIGGSAELR